MESNEKESLYNFGKELSIEAAKILFKFWKQRNEPIWKGPTDFKTQADDTVARLVRQKIQSRFPEHSIWSEELPLKNNNENWWYVDELDGTLPFARGYSDRWSFSIGFQSEQFKFGLVNLVGINKQYSAVEGGESFCNNKKIRVSNCSDINKAVVAWDAGKSLNRDEVLIFVKKLLADNGANYTPANGCASAALMSVANGELDAYFATNLQPEDMAGAVPIIRGAGGIVTTIDGKEWRPHCDSILAANPILHKKLLDFFA